MIDAAAHQPPSQTRSELRAAAAAVCFLTRVPLGRYVSIGAHDLARAGLAFPLVGAAIGGLVGAVAVYLGHPLGAWLAALIGLTVGALATGALHLDALADTADALGATTRAGALTIMRDHALGSYGAIAVVLDLMLKAGALSGLITHHNVLATAVVAGALSRASAVVLAAALPSARGGGLADALAHGGRPRAVLAVAIAVATSIVVAGTDAVIAAGVAAALLGLLACWYRRWLGGVTGDSLGAAIELTELAVFLTAVGLLEVR